MFIAISHARARRSSSSWPGQIVGASCSAQIAVVGRAARREASFVYTFYLCLDWSFDLWGLVLLYDPIGTANILTSPPATLPTTYGPIGNTAAKFHMDTSPRSNIKVLMPYVARPLYNAFVRLYCACTPRGRYLLVILYIGGGLTP